MPELSHDTADDGFHEIQLSGKQLVFLFMATTVVAVVIFICGVLVGRDVRPAAAEAAAQAPAVETTPATAQPAPIADDTPTPVDDVVANTSYDERLEGDKPVPEKLQVVKNAESAPSSVPEPAPEPVRAEPPAPKAAAAAKTEPAARPDSLSGSSEAAVPAAASSGQWIVQVAALRDRSAAASIVRRLSGKGYPAFVVSPAQSASTRVYKVQVGRYEERRDAEQVAHRLKTEEKLSSWISR